jgi:predicted urease superfamily metal-dependent hydrolase
MNIKKLSAKTRNTIKALAKSKGLTEEEVVKHFQNIFFRKKVSIHLSVFS